MSSKYLVHCVSATACDKGKVGNKEISHCARARRSIGVLSYYMRTTHFHVQETWRWLSHDVQSWNKNTSHSLSPPYLLDPWGKALRGGSSELDWGRMEWVDVSGLMRSKCTQRGNCNLQLHSYLYTCPLMQVRMGSEWIMAVRGPTNNHVRCPTLSRHSQVSRYYMCMCILCRNQTQHSHTEGEMADAPLTVLPVCIRTSVVTQVQLLVNTAPTQIKKGATEVGRQWLKWYALGSMASEPWSQCMLQQEGKMRYIKNISDRELYFIHHHGIAIHQSSHPTATGLQLCFEIELWWKVHLTVHMYVYHQIWTIWTVDGLLTYNAHAHTTKST